MSSPSRPRRSSRLGRSLVAAAALSVVISCAFSASPEWVLSAVQAAVNDPEPPVSHAYPADYGPDASACFSPLLVPAGALPAGAGIPGDGGTGAGAAAKDYLVLNVAARRLYFYRDGTLARVYQTAVGHPTHHTPIGHYSILCRTKNPTWYPLDGRPPVPPGPANPLGTRWMAWLASGYGLHGTNVDSSIGKAVSHGCVRMHNAEVEALFDQIQVGTPFDVVYEPVELTGFGQGFVLTLFPDIYSRVGDYAAFLDSRLSLAGVQLDAAQRAWLLVSVPTLGAVSLDTASPVYVGTHPIQTPVLGTGPAPDGQPLVLVRAVGETLGLAVAWDPVAGLPTLDGVLVPSIGAWGRAFATVDDIARAAGIRLSWTWQATGTSGGLVCHKLSLYPGLVWVDGQLVSRQAFRGDDGTYVPLRTVAEALGLSLWWDTATSSAVLSGVPVQTVIVEGRGYARADILAAALAGFPGGAGTPGSAPALVVSDDGVSITR